jgi:hypothetical protein
MLHRTLVCLKWIRNSASFQCAFNWSRMNCHYEFRNLTGNLPEIAAKFFSHRFANLDIVDPCASSSPIDGMRIAQP